MPRFLLRITSVVRGRHPFVYLRYKSLYDGPDAIDESDGHTAVFPIPADVRALNQNLTQNPGY